MPGRVRESYVRPPIVGNEPPPRWVARWRFRVIVAAIAIGLAIVVALIVLKYVINTEQNPTFGTAPFRAKVVPTAQQATRAVIPASLGR